MKQHNHEFNFEMIIAVVSDAVTQIVDKVIKVFGEIKDAIQRRKSQTHDPRGIWPTIFDTRRASQVICNKPRNLVKKII